MLPRQSLECSYVFIFVTHFEYFSCPSGYCFEISHHTSSLSFFQSTNRRIRKIIILIFIMCDSVCSNGRKTHGDAGNVSSYTKF
jgi:hypothetical protein